MSTDVQTAIGTLTFDQAASTLPVPSDRKTLALKRLIARGAIATIENPTLGTVITVESMKDFVVNGSASRALREHQNMPPETLLPIFIVDGGNSNWFDLRYVKHLVDMFQTTIVSLIKQQMPPSINELAAAARFNSLEYDAVKTLSPGNMYIPADVDPRIDTKIAPQIVALIRQPIDLRQLTMARAKQQAIPFKNLGELVLVVQLQYFAMSVIRQRAVRSHLPSTIRMSDSVVAVDGFEALYASASQYGEIVIEAQDAMQKLIGTAQTYMYIPEITQGNSSWPENMQYNSIIPGSYRQYTRYISHEMILKIAETSYPRLVALSF